MKQLSKFLFLEAYSSNLFGFNKPRVQDVSFVKVFNVVSIDAFQTLRVYYLDKQITEYIGITSGDNKTGKYYYLSDIYYKKSIGIEGYFELMNLNIKYNNVEYSFPNNSLVLEINETNTRPDQSKYIDIESTQAFNRITIATTIRDERCFQGKNDFFCNRFLENSKNAQYIILISKSPIQSKYPSSIDGLIPV